MSSTRRLALSVAVVALAVPSAPAAAAGPLREPGYWAYADRLQQALERYWDPRTGTFGPSAPLNADALLTYSVAALRGHQGPARDDARARNLVDALVASPPFVTTVPPRWRDSQSHAPGFVTSLDRRFSNQHLVIDSEIIDGLRYAWRARQALGLSSAQSAAIADRLHRTASGRFWRWPMIRLNQINWYALVYAADAEVTGNPVLLRHDLRLQIARFLAGAGPRGSGAGNLGPGLHFNYLPASTPGAHMNVDSAEYANITASFTREYRQARSAGMAAPSPAGQRLLRRWFLRILAGYWTHGGYVNWDTGFGFRRWHQTKKLALSQQALIGMASAPGLVPARERAWAKWLFDRGLGFYDRQLQRWGNIPAGTFFDVHAHHQDKTSARLALARMESNAARAIAAGLGSAAATQPPSMFAFDPDTGRLAITTPAYNTAVVPTSRGSFPYGGIEL
ncbi:MAG: hypothetical protein QOE28_2400, partial [Solirubrobacteraceae bacterium]|nr:hypothetical protein [Solirubrobacteraceae bacterium]